MGEVCAATRHRPSTWDPARVPSAVEVESSSLVLSGTAVIPLFLSEWLQAMVGFTGREKANHYPPALASHASAPLKIRGELSAVGIRHEITMLSRIQSSDHLRPALNCEILNVTRLHLWFRSIKSTESHQNLNPIAGKFSLSTPSLQSSEKTRS